MNLRQRFRRHFSPANLVIDLLGLTGIAAAVVYALGVKLSGGTLESDPSRLENLWANVATDLVGIWITVRLIEALVQGREDRHRGRHRLVDVMREQLRIADDLVPTFYDWRLRELGNLTAWTRGLVDRTRRFLSAEELALVFSGLSALERAEQAATVCVQARETVEAKERPVDRLEHWPRDAGGVERTMSIWDYRGRSPLQNAEDEYQKFKDSAAYDGPLGDLVDGSRAHLTTSGMPPEHRTTVEGYLDAVEAAVRVQHEFERVLEISATAIYSADALLLAEHPESVPLPKRRRLRAKSVPTTDARNPL